MKGSLKMSMVMVAASSLLVAGCWNSSTPNSSEAACTAAPSVTPAAADSGKKLKIVATFYPMVEFSKQVAGNHAEVIGLIPSGTEPHDWEPTAKDMAELKEADVFVYNGIVEGWAEKALESASNEKRIAVEASKGIDLMEDGKILDPHVWLDPALAQKEVASIEAALEKADPANKDDYKNNADAYIAKLKDLDQTFKSGLTEVKRKEFVTQHAAFGYMAKEYGLTQIPIAGLSPEQEPSPDQMASIVKFAKENQVKTIFFETLVDPKVAKVVANEIGAKTDVLNPIEGLTDEDKKNNLDYIGIMKNNLEGLKKALSE
jgi:zinc transport system substrate-binding protein